MPDLHTKHMSIKWENVNKQSLPVPDSIVI